mmetsp:Transcript_57541/g.136879  ORF Transcript_57541/g.136879 Transcript_57541/m.136879 type:complete len:490 (-) Transcript_57541:227-1696(-)
MSNLTAKKVAYVEIHENNNREDIEERLEPALQSDFPSAPGEGAARPCSPTSDERFSLLRVLGEGSFGEVFACRDVRTGRDVAMKKFKKVLCTASERTTSLGRLRCALREIRLLRQVDHPNVVSSMGVIQAGGGSSLFEQDCLYVVLELMAMDLHTLIRRHPQDLRSRSFITQILLGVLYLHSAGIIHCDLKPQNIFVDRDQVKVGDFGLAQSIAARGSETFSLRPEECSDLGLQMQIGTSVYRAPEVILCPGRYGFSVDMWAIGCILYEMWHCQHLFEGGANTADQLRKILAVLGCPRAFECKWVPEESYKLLRWAVKKAPSQQEGWPECLGPRVHPLGVELFEHLMEFNPHRRCSAEGALRHRYLQLLAVPSVTEKDIEIAKAASRLDMTYDDVFAVPPATQAQRQKWRAAAQRHLLRLLGEEVRGERLSRVDVPEEMIEVVKTIPAWRWRCLLASQCHELWQGWLDEDMPLGAERLKKALHFAQHCR